MITRLLKALRIDSFGCKAKIMPISLHSHLEWKYQVEM